jgi:hypothetical protein
MSDFYFTFPILRTSSRCAQPRQRVSPPESPTPPSQNQFQPPPLGKVLIVHGEILDVKYSRDDCLKMKTQAYHIINNRNDVLEIIMLNYEANLLNLMKNMSFAMHVVIKYKSEEKLKRNMHEFM